MTQKSFIYAIASALGFGGRSTKTADAPKVETQIIVDGDTELHIYKNLAICLIQGADNISRQYLTLEEAMRQNLVVLNETGNVGELSIDNLSDRYVFLMSGDIVKGGRQDRTIADDVILQPHRKNVPLKSFCVEHNRWHQRANEDVRRFSYSKKMLNDRPMKIASRLSRNQAQVWDEVDNYQRGANAYYGEDIRSKVSESSLELTLDNKKLKASIKEYVDALRPSFDGKDDIIGFAFFVNGKLSTIDSYGSAELFSALRDKLLESAAGEAVTKYQKNKETEQPSVVKIMELINKSESGVMTKNFDSNITLIQTFRCAEGVLFKTLHSEGGVEELVHTAAYSTDDIDTDHNRQRFQYGGRRY